MEFDSDNSQNGVILWIQSLKAHLAFAPQAGHEGPGLLNTSKALT